MAAIDYDGGLTCALSATDLGRSIDWYNSVLGFTLLYRLEDMAWCEMSTSVGRVNVGISQVETVPQGGGAVLTWGVKDIVAAKAAIEAQGVRTDGDINHIPDMVKLLTFYDPDDNALMFYEDCSPQG